MKQVAFALLMSLLALITFNSCSNSTYERELEQEQTLIKSYIKRNNIKVINKLPSDDSWKPNEYYLSSSGLYYRLLKPGTGTEEIENNNTYIPRYKRFYLTQNSDTVSTWTSIDSAYPATYVFGTTSLPSAAFQEAVSYMKKNDAEAIIIVYSKINEESFWNPATPVAYHLKFRFKK